MKTAWSDDWEKRIRERIQSLGCESMVDFLGMFPGESYFLVAKRLGEDVAPLQLTFLQYQDAMHRNQARCAVIDSLVRIMQEMNKRGWNVGLHWKRRMSHIYVDWLNTPGFYPDLNFEAQKKRVWAALIELQPHDGWLPKDVNDPLLDAAFRKGWSLNG